MKKYILSLFAVLIYALSYGQMLRFTEPTNEWTFQSNSIDGITIFTEVYTGDTMINGIAYHTTSLGQFVYREDTIAQKAYVRRVTLQGYTDTVEHVLYDYNLRLGDTLTQFVDNYTLYNVVTSLDSFQFDNRWYKIWTFGSDYPHKVIEGVGCIDGLFEPVNPLAYPNNRPFLTCFSTNGENPAFAIPGYTNPADCALSVNEAIGAKSRISIPNPASSNSVITVPEAYHNGRMLIYDPIGRTCANLHLSGGEQIPFTTNLTAAGMYYYRIKDRTNHNFYSGRFVFEP